MICDIAAKAELGQSDRRRREEHADPAIPSMHMGIVSNTRVPERLYNERGRSDRWMYNKPVDIRSAK
jgi:hypothetical protein